jgi:hypothetical protein
MKYKVYFILYIQPLKMELIEGSETSANHNLTPGKYPKEYIQKIYYMLKRGTAVALWLRCCATNRKVPGSIPAGVSGFFIDIKSFHGVDSASNRNEYQEYFLGVKVAGA